MKYAIIVNGKNNDTPVEDSSVGFFQWLNVFHGRLLYAKNAFENLRDGDYDLIHIRLIQDNVLLFHRLKELLGSNAKTKIMVSLDIPVRYWSAEFDDVSRLQSVCRDADFIFATEFDCARKLSRYIGKMVYEIPHPAHIENIKSFQTEAKNNSAVILYGRPRNVDRSIALVKKSFSSKLRIIVLTYRYSIADRALIYDQDSVEFVECGSEAELCKRLSASRFVLVPGREDYYGNEYHNYGNLIVYCAALGIVVLGDNRLNVMRRCYSELLFAPVKNPLLPYLNCKNNVAKIKNVVETAKSKVHYFNWGNTQKRLLDRFYDATNDHRFNYHDIEKHHDSLYQQIRHIHGAKIVHYDNDEFVVVCLVKNSKEYIQPFVEHCNRLGAKHFFFIDNCSTDETVMLLKQYPNVTIYQSDLPHKRYECENRRVIIEEHCRNKWCLCVDIDELFDYPYSDVVSMKNLLRYLNSHHYTALLSYLLDMFSRETVFTEKNNENMIDEYCYYDVSNINKSQYHGSFIAFNNYNKLSDHKMKNYTGGIRGTIFKNKESGYLLAKQPLIFIDAEIEPIIHPHFSNKTYIADINGVLKHYKFISSFKERVIRSLKSDLYCYHTTKEYKAYLNAIKNKRGMQCYSAAAKKLNAIEQLVQDGFLMVSKAYQAYLKRLCIAPIQNKEPA